MARLVGTEGSVTIGGVTPKGVTQWSVDPQADEIESTGMDSQGWGEYEGGIKRWTGTAEINWDGAGALNPLTVLGTKVAVSFVSNDTAPKITYSGTALVTGTPTTSEVNGIVKLTVNLRGSGVLTLTPAYS